MQELPGEGLDYEGIGRPHIAPPDPSAGGPRPTYKPGFVDRMSEWLNSWVMPDLDRNPNVREAEKWVADYNPKQKPELYSIVLKFSEQRYEQTLKIYDSIDKKADDLMRTAGALGAALVAAAKLLDMSQPRAIVPAVGFLVISVIIAARSRWPAESKTPMSARDYFQVADNDNVNDKYVLEAVAAASCHAATVGLLVLIAWKANQLKRSSWAFCIGLAALVFIPIFGR